MIVLDASATVDLLLGTDRAAAVAHALRPLREVHAPEVIDPEVIAVIRRWTLRGWLAAEHGERAVEELGELALVRHRHAALRRRAWELRDRCSAYDAFYVALAEMLDAELLTTDARQGRAATGLVVVREPILCEPRASLRDRSAPPRADGDQLRDRTGLLAQM